jgi:hypothetical protein
MRYVIVLLFFAVASCKTNKNKTVQVRSYADTNTQVKTTGSPLTDNSYYFFPSDTVSYPVHILSTHGYHGEEIWPNAEKEKWMGLFYNRDGYYVSETTITISKAHDEITDENESDSTGRSVSVNNSDTAILLFSGYAAKQGKVQTVKLDSGYVLPGDTVNFSYNGTGYRIFATGKRVYEAGGEYFDLADYKLYFQGTKNGRTVTQTIMIQPKFEETRPTVMFIGDIDGDGIPDLIIDTSYHYNAFVPTLYLSKPASKNELLKVMGLHVSVGMLSSN